MVKLTKYMSFKEGIKEFLQTKWHIFIQNIYINVLQSTNRV